MTAALQRFYGGNPLEWLRLPLVYLRAYVANMESLRAAENLNDTQVGLLGSGNVKQSDVDSQLRAWSRTAYGRSGVKKPLTEEERVGMIKAAGISV